MDEKELRIDLEDDNRYHVRVDDKIVGTYDTLEEAVQAYMESTATH